MPYNLKFKKLTRTLEYESPDRTKGLWIYSLHPKFTENNYKLWQAVDRANGEINAALEEWSLPYYV